MPSRTRPYPRRPALEARSRPARPTLGGTRRSGREFALVHQPCPGRLLERGCERAIFGTIGAADRSYPAQVIFGLVAVALLDLPETVIVPSQDMVRIGFQRTLIPDLGELVVAELAV